MIKKLLSLAATCLLFFPCFAFTYVFNGNGDWYDNSKWAGGSFPPSMDASNIITINGNCFMSGNGIPMNDKYADHLGILTVSAGATLTIGSGVSIYSLGAWNINGTLINGGGILNYGQINISGTWTDVNAGNLSTLSVINLVNGGTFGTGTAFTTGSNSILKGMGNFTANSFTNTSQLSPGNSPGTINFTGDYIALSTAVHNFEVAGTATTDYDRILVTGNVTLSGTLNVSLINGFNPTINHDLPIITGNIIGTFTTVNIPASYTLVYNANSVVLRHLSALPVNFLKLSATRGQDATLINWEVKDEFQVDRYEVERSVDGRIFSLAGTVKAVGADGYHYADRNISTSKTWYRIKSVDLDGSSKYSSVVLANGATAKSVNIYKSAIGVVTINHPAAGRNAMVSVYSPDGKLLMKKKAVLNGSITELNVGSPGRGVLFVHYQDGEITKVNTLVFL
jgi:hypothetical protein